MSKLCAAKPIFCFVFDSGIQHAWVRRSTVHFAIASQILTSHSLTPLGNTLPVLYWNGQWVSVMTYDLCTVSTT